MSNVCIKLFIDIFISDSSNKYCLLQGRAYTNQHHDIQISIFALQKYICNMLNVYSQQKSVSSVWTI